MRPPFAPALAPLLALLCLVACSPGGDTDRGGSDPEPEIGGILLIGVDTLRAEMLGAYGDPHGLTPHLDALAARSVRFADLSAPAPWTLPSFATLLTGLSPQTHDAGRRLQRAERIRDVELSRLDARLPTLASVLRAAGWQTAGFYNNPFLSPSFGFGEGFDSYAGPEAPEPAENTVERALTWLATREQGRPFFLFVHLFDPHTPYEPPEPFCTEVARRLEPGFADQPCYLERSTRDKAAPPARRPWGKALYRAEVAYTDHEIGRLLAGLEELGLAAETATLVTSDHGEAFWEREEQADVLGYHPVADHGHTLYQELLRVPGVLYLPGIEPRVVDEPVGLEDFFPTLLAAAGVAAPVNEGRDLGSLLRGAGSESPPEALASAATAPPPLLGGYLLYGDDRLSARRGPWKLIAGPLPAPPEGPAHLELYHLGDDPGERQDRSVAEPTITRGLLRAARLEQQRRAELRQILLQGDTDTQPAEISEEQRKRLRALGYLQ